MENIESNKNKNIIKMDDYIRIPEDYEMDIIVDLNNQIDWKKINQKYKKEE